MGLAQMHDLYDKFDGQRLDIILAGVGGDHTGSDDEAHTARLEAATADPAGTVDRIVHNIANGGMFAWRGGNQAAAGLLSLGYGDCHTLVWGCVEVLRALEIPAQEGSYKQPFFIERNDLRLIDGQTGNVDGTHWYFDNHYWLEAAERTYDLLFGGGPLDTTYWRYLADTSLEGGYTIFYFQDLSYPLYSADPATGYPLTAHPERALVLNVDAKHVHNPSCAPTCTLL